MKLYVRFLVAFLASGGILSAAGHGVVRQADAGSEARASFQGADSAAARELTVKLLASRSVHARAKSAAEKALALAPLVEIARQRQEELLDLVDSDPAEVLRVALPAGTREGLPAEVRAHVEEAADEAGEIEVLHVDHVDAAADHYLHFLNTPKGRYSLHFAGAVPDIATGATVSVRGALHVTPFCASTARIRRLNFPPARNGGTRRSNDAAQSTRVSPSSKMHDPIACLM